MFSTDDEERGGGGDFKINKPIRETKALGEKRERERQGKEWRTCGCPHPPQKK